jgi:signal transduction histidine kinase
MLVSKKDSHQAVMLLQLFLKYYASGTRRKTLKITGSRSISFFFVLYIQIWMPAAASTLEIELTDSERQWLEDHPTVTFTGDPNWLPYEAFDSNGEYIGIVAEHLRLISKSSGIRFEMSPSKTWTESTQKAKNGFVDILSETDDSDLKSHLTFSKNYLSNPIVIVMHNRENYVENISRIKDRSIALIRDYGYASKIRRRYPDIQFTTVDDIQDGLIAVSTGKIDALLCTLALCSYTIAELGLNNVRIVGKTEFDTKLALGVQKDLPQLVSILNKAIDRISPGQQQVILDAWIKQKFAEKTDYTLVFQVAGVAIVLLAIFFFWNRRLSREVSLRMLIEGNLKQEMGEREKVSEELEHKNAELERFAYTVSHDLKTPLVTIKGFVGLLARDIAANDSGRIRGDIEKINSATDTMGLLLNDLLELSRIGQVMGDPVSCNLTEIARQAIELMATKVDETGVEIIVEDMPLVSGDKLRLVEVYLNLVENAIKFMGDQKSPRIDIGARVDDGETCFYVTDNGDGIAAEYHHLVFGLFERLNAGMEGTGIGLTLVKRIIEVHGGKIWVESDGAGCGSTMLFTLPNS